MITKKQKDLVKGDVIRVEFGDYDNWVTVVVDEIANDNRTQCYSCKIIGHYLNGRAVEMYGRPDEDVEIVTEAP